jgi:hypothetical protein
MNSWQMWVRTPRHEATGQEDIMVGATFRTSGRRAMTTWIPLLALVVVAGLASCDGGSSTGPQDDPPGEDATDLFPGLAVSDVFGQVGGGGALAAASAGIVYVSACPGTFPDIDSLAITSSATGETKTVAVETGGFDPVALSGASGDELTLLLYHSDGSTSRHVTRVPPRRRPRVVRTSPPKDATQVVLSTAAVVVFSEPIDPSTLTESVLLILDESPVNGTLTLSEDGLRVEFAPAEPLQSGATYTLLITTGLLDLDGDALEAEVRARFRTEILPVEVELCAKQAVLEEINAIQEPWPNDDANWTGPQVNSTIPACGVQDYADTPHGTLRYYPEGPRFDWEFDGVDFVPWTTDETGYRYHQYVLVFMPGESWPGRNLVCLKGAGDPATGVGDWIANDSGQLTGTGSYNFGADLTDARFWIVRRDWVDCTGHDNNTPQWTNLGDSPRLTNDRNDDGQAEASETLIFCSPNCDYGEGELTYDWAFETALVNYHDTDGPGS